MADMALTTPSPNAESAASVARRQIMPTELSSSELRELSAALRSQSFFSARTMLSDLLDEYKAAMASILNPEQVSRADRVTEDNPEGLVNTGLNDAYARQHVKDLLQRINYQPDADQR